MFGNRLSLELTAFDLGYVPKCFFFFFGLNWLNKIRAFNSNNLRFIDFYI